jgi:hypothetical protein
MTIYASLHGPSGWLVKLAQGWAFGDCPQDILGYTVLMWKLV